MRPNVTEQLRGLSRILDEVVAPELSDPYPADILAGVCATLDALAAGWLEVPAYLRWDAEVTAGLLTELASGDPRLDPALAASISAAAAAAPPDPTDLEALQAHHERIRAALVLAVPALTASGSGSGSGSGSDEALGELRQRVTAHLRERAARYPLKTVWRPPTPDPARPPTDPAPVTTGPPRAH